MAQGRCFSKKRVRFEPQRTDRLLNSYNPAMILVWRANIDFKPVMSTDAARSKSQRPFSTPSSLTTFTASYIAKYASKAEQQAPAFPALLSSIVNQMGENGTVPCRAILEGHHSGFPAAIYSAEG
ncbi:hypothetical protein C8R43DRAFT_225706 [Mycena crocata]|nr:hypothetical protein C8R43DRAFT_225706 [Mycena crocata]